MPLDPQARQFSSARNAARRFCRGSVLLLAGLLASGCSSSDPVPSSASARGADLALTAADAAPEVSVFEDPEVSEASGIQRSLRIPGLFWVHNDSGHDATVYATDAAGKALGRIRLAGVEAIDWEDLSAFAQDNHPYLVVGDIGDNASSRSSIQLYLFPEPRIEAWSPGFDQLIEQYATVELQYADGRGHDCESMVVDADSDEILVITKDVLQPNRQSLWTASLSRALRTGGAQLEFQGELASLNYSATNPGDSNPGSFAATGMDISPDRSELALLTYGELATGPGRVFIWRRQPRDSWATALAQPYAAKLSVPAAGNHQAEGIGYASEGRHLMVVAENPTGPASTISPIRR